MTTTTISAGQQYAVNVLPALDQHPTLEGGPTVNTNLSKRRYATVDAAPVRAHVRSLMAAGIGSNRVGELAGVPPGTVRYLLYGQPVRGYGPARQIYAGTADALLAVRASEAVLAGGVVVDGTGTRRRLQALMVLGWSGVRLAGFLGTPQQHIVAAINGDHEVTARTARKVRALYGRLWDKRPPETTKGERVSATKTRAHAERCKWNGPWAWDEEVTLPVLCGGCDADMGVFYVARGIDDPLARPYPWKRGKGVPSVDIAADFAELAARHPARFAEPEKVRGDIAERFGMSRHTLDTKLARAARVAESRVAA